MANQVEEIKVEEKVETNQEAAVTPVEPKQKKGFLAGLSTVGKIVLGVTVTAFVAVGAVVVKTIIGKDDDNTEDQETSEPAAE